MGASRASFPRFRREGTAPRIELTADDIEILRRVHRHRFIRADDIYRLFPERSRDHLSRRLAGLYRNQFLDRPIAQVDRFQEGGSQPFVYGLAAGGARQLAEVCSLPIKTTDWKSRNRSYTRENLDHTLAVTRLLVDLELACRAHGDVTLITAEEIVAGAPEATRQLAQPLRWPVPVRWGGLAGTVHVIPDAVFGLQVRLTDGRSARSYIFLEIDRGSMTIVPTREVRNSEAFLYRATILRKLLAYAQGYQQGLHSTHLALPIARVLTLTTTEGRSEAMREAANTYLVKSLRLPPGLFLFGAGDQRDGTLNGPLRDASGEPAHLFHRSSTM